VISVSLCEIFFCFSLLIKNCLRQNVTIVTFLYLQNTLQNGTNVQCFISLICVIKEAEVIGKKAKDQFK